MAPSRTANQPVFFFNFSENSMKIWQHDPRSSGRHTERCLPAWAPCSPCRAHWSAHWPGEAGTWCAAPCPTPIPSGTHRQSPRPCPASFRPSWQTAPAGAAWRRPPGAPRQRLSPARKRPVCPRCRCHISPELRSRCRRRLPPLRLPLRPSAVPASRGRRANGRPRCGEQQLAGRAAASTSLRGDPGLLSTATCAAPSAGIPGTGRPRSIGRYIAPATPPRPRHRGPR